MKLYQAIAQTIASIKTCETSCNWEWFEKHKETLARLTRELPSGSGIDNGCEIDRDASNDTRLIITFSFHHMDDNGYYDGWTDYRLTLRPCLRFGIDVKIQGEDRNNIKDYLYETFIHTLNSEVQP